jgi:hypothetical protein
MNHCSVEHPRDMLATASYFHKALASDPVRAEHTFLPDCDRTSRAD